MEKEKLKHLTYLLKCLLQKTADKIKYRHAKGLLLRILGIQ